MNANDMQELKTITAALHDPIKVAVKQAVLEAFQGTVFADAIAKGVLRALDEHHAKTSATMVEGFDFAKKTGDNNGWECPTPNPAPQPPMPRMRVVDPGGNPVEEGQTLRQVGNDSIVYDRDGNAIRHFKGKELVTRVGGEREVWAQVYAATLGQHWEGKDYTAFHPMATEAADAAVKIFRQRFK